VLVEPADFGSKMMNEEELVVKAPESDRPVLRPIRRLSEEKMRRLNLNEVMNSGRRRPTDQIDGDLYGLGMSESDSGVFSEVEGKYSSCSRSGRSGQNSRKNTDDERTSMMKEHRNTDDEGTPKERSPTGTTSRTVTDELSDLDGMSEGSGTPVVGGAGSILQWKKAQKSSRAAILRWKQKQRATMDELKHIGVELEKASHDSDGERRTDRESRTDRERRADVEQASHDQPVTPLKHSNRVKTMRQRRFSGGTSSSSGSACPSVLSGSREDLAAFSNNSSDLETTPRSDEEFRDSATIAAEKWIEARNRARAASEEARMTTEDLTEEPAQAPRPFAPASRNRALDRVVHV